MLMTLLSLPPPLRELSGFLSRAVPNSGPRSLQPSLCAFPPPLWPVSWLAVDVARYHQKELPELWEKDDGKDLLGGAL